MLSLFTLVFIMGMAFYIGRLFGERRGTIIEREKFLKVLQGIKAENGLSPIAKYHLLYLRTLITKRLNEEWWK